MNSLKKIPRFLKAIASSVRPFTSARLPLPAVSNDKEDANLAASPLIDGNAAITTPFFKKLKDHLNAHFSDILSIEKVVETQSHRQGLFLRAVNAVIITHLNKEKFDTKALGREMALSRSQLYRRLKPLIQQSPAHYIQMVRLQKAKELLDQTDLLIGEIAFQTGFASQSHFTRTFRRIFGYNPSEFRTRHKDGLSITNTTS